MGIQETIDGIKEISLYDEEALVDAQKSYGNSWKKRGGVGAFMMLARKWDRIENQAKKFNYDIFETIIDDPSPEGVLDDIGDLRRYLILVEIEIRDELSGFTVATPQEPTEANHSVLGSAPLQPIVEGNKEESAEAN
jgi:hypothetical protein